jgi:hypothetical protein
LSHELSSSFLYFIENTEIYGNFLENTDIYGRFLENIIYGHFLENTYIIKDIFSKIPTFTEISCPIVGITTRLQAGYSCVRIPAGVKDFFFTKTPRPFLGPTPLLFNGYRSCFLGVKWQGREVGHSQHLMSSLRMTGAIPLLLLHAFMMWKGTVLPLFNSSLQLLPDKYSI